MNAPIRTISEKTPSGKKPSVIWSRRFDDCEPIAITSRRSGNAITNSVSRAIDASTRPPRKPAIVPSTVPISIAISVPPIATSSDTRPPSSSRSSSSRPSVPSAPATRKVLSVPGGGSLRT